MPTRNINLTPGLDRLCYEDKSGRYENASAVVRAGLRTLKRQELKRPEKEKKRQENDREEQEHAAKLAACAARSTMATPAAWPLAMSLAGP